MREVEELSKMGVPSIWNYIKGDEDRKIAGFVLAQKGFERPLVVRQGTSLERVKILRATFDATMRDPEFLAEAEKGRLDLDPASGTEVQEQVDAFYATPKDIVEKARAKIKP